ncbi:F-box/LRR-repeat/kelch-repeat protein At1g09650-like [Aegilops tauschii subsp. strangulata]|uniref:F-box/LRR-repeat/kelch-repeat protein At1g09650-like n=1 Tax=Aegilops tauschii subsp. strangulata TaxID=200361 RepID=UPI00098A8C4D|nr:F-box protein At4g22390-like [Aegilops tauschii subsp. strangulata]
MILEEDGSSYFYVWQPGGSPPTKRMPHKFHRPAPLTRPLHGLVLICCPSTGYHVCNPSTGETLDLPDTALPAKMNNRLPFYHRRVAYGLGYYSTTDEYKVVRLFSSTYKGNNLTFCEVFDLGGAPYWRPIAGRPPACILDENPGIFLDECVHFLCRGGRIISFDVRSETFGVVEPPPNTWHASVRMTELDGCLCVYHENIGHRHGPYHIWVLRDYAKQQRRWEQLCRIDPMAWQESDRKQLRSSWIAPLVMYDGDSG